MNFLKKLFGSKPESTVTEDNSNPENTRLNYLLNIWGEHPSDENYHAVMQELLKGNGYLLLPSVNDGKESNGWQTAEVESTLKLTSVFDMDGVKVLGAFSNQQALMAWAKKPTEYTAMKGSTVAEFCEDNGIDRIVINSDQKTMYVLERNRSNIKSYNIEKETKVLVGAPAKPLKKEIVEKLVKNFRKVESITEAYQYAQILNDETSIVLGINMQPISDDSRIALQNAINSSIEGEQLEMPLDVMILQTEEWLETARNVENSLFYKR